MGPWVHWPMNAWAFKGPISLPGTMPLSPAPTHHPTPQANHRWVSLVTHHWCFAALPHVFVSVQCVQVFISSVWWLAGRAYAWGRGGGWGGVMGWWLGWRRGIGEVTGEKLGTVVTVMCTVWLTALNKLHSWSKHANNLVSLVYVIWHYKIWKSNNMSCAAQRSEGHVCGNVWRAMFHNVEHTGNICFLARYSEGWCSSAQDFCWLG